MAVSTIIKTISDNKFLTYDTILKKWNQILPQEPATLPSEKQFDEFGMKDLSILDRKDDKFVKSVTVVENDLNGSGLKVFSTGKIDTKKYILNSIDGLYNGNKPV